MNRFYKIVKNALDLKSLYEQAQAAGMQAVGVSITGTLYKWDPEKKGPVKIEVGEAAEILVTTPDEVAKLALYRGEYAILDPVIPEKEEPELTEALASEPEEVKASEEPVAETPAEVPPAEEPEKASPEPGVPDEPVVPETPKPGIEDVLERLDSLAGDLKEIGLKLGVLESIVVTLENIKETFESLKLE
jgi:hypothetical protein